MEERGVDGRLTLNSERTSYPARVSAGIDRKRALSVAAAGALVVAAVVLGALALRSPAPAAAPRSSAPLQRSAAARARPARAPAGGEAALAAVASDIAAGRRGSAETALRRAARSARRRGHARAGRRSAPALSPGRGGHLDRRPARTRRRRRPRPRARAPSRARAALVGAESGGDRRVAGDALARSRRALRADRRQRPAPDVSQGLSALGALPLRARLASPLARAGSGRPALRRLPHSTTPTALQFSSRTRARLAAEKALALDASNIDAEVAVIVLGFDKDVARAGSRAAGSADAEPARALPARASTSASCSPGSARTPRPGRNTGKHHSSTRAA